MDTYISTYISHCEIFYKNSFMILLDMNLTAIFVGKKFLDATKLSEDETIGKNLYQTAPIPDENIQPSLECFEKAIKQKAIVNAIVTNLLHKDIKFHFMGASIIPVCNPESDDVMAVRFEFYKINWKSAIRYVLNNINYVTICDSIMHDDLLLTSREQEIAFLLFYCHSTREIADIISKLHNKNVSSKTIHNIISGSLYSKFNSFNRDDLLENLRKRGYDEIIPNSLLRNHFIDLT